MKRTKELIIETLFATEEEKRTFENYNRWMELGMECPECNEYRFKKSTEDKKLETVKQDDNI